jgi:AsmA protein
MRILLRILVGVVVLLVLALGAAAFFLPRLVDTPAVRERIQEAARASLGRELRYEKLSLGLLPPRLVVERPSLAATRAEGASLEAEGVALQVALVPLLSRAVVIDSLVVEGARVRLVRTKEGLELPVTPPEEGAAGAEPGREAPAQAAQPEEPQAGPGVALAVREFALRDATLVLDDRAVSPPVVWELRNLSAQARAESLDAPIPFDFSAELASGGKLRGEGTLTLAGQLDARLELDGVALAPARSYVEADRLGGALSGSVKASGAAEAARVSAQLELADGDLALDEIALRGGMSLRADLENLPASPSGSFEIDATAAELVYGEAFRKPPGTQATVSGRLVPQQEGGVGLDEVRLHVRNLDAEGKVRTGKRLRAELSAPPFELAGWEELVPALAGQGLSGRVGVETLAVATEPLDLRGRIALDGLQVQLPDTPPIVVRGLVLAEGTSARTQDLVVQTVDQTLDVEGSVTGLDARPRYDVRVRTAKSDTNRLLSAFSSVKETVYGPLTLDGRFSGPLDAPEPVRALGGNLQLQIDQGRLKGVSLLQTTFDKMGTLGQFALLAGALRGGKTLQRFYDDEFELLAGSFRLADGKARTDDLRLVYRHYRVDLRGTLGLLDRGLDATGELTIDEEIDQALAAEAGSAAASAPSASRVIPLARVTGTLDAPRVDVTPQALASLATRYSVGRYTEKYEKKIDEVLGEGSGGQVRDVLEGILGGANRRQ